ncbi:hypothetical protein ACFQI7_20640 [Paenibacillus allorhizosphaerae]|uniref:Uncharacterized protein n=1 Tax=Paenibacillus allorhizosphaerae TaxID=2849866 RepID=A0ABN7TMV1_9BACL|nr:hypothetical protein [Paenibacillus allorhizosphaerae]CAG7647788.1 hypothetical protein PAECIP111802_04064 [Paenibacillus allorhizosphaerae]
MHPADETTRAKLHILNSLARSQRALAKIIEVMAESAESTNAGKTLIEQIDAISRYQRQIAVKMIGIRIRRKTFGLPGKPWIHPMVAAGCAANRRHGSDSDTREVDPTEA